MYIATWVRKGVGHGNKLFPPIWQEVNSGLPLLIMGLRREEKATGNTMEKRKGDTLEKIFKSQYNVKGMNATVQYECVIVNCVYSLQTILKESLQVRLIRLLGSGHSCTLSRPGFGDGWDTGFCMPAHQWCRHTLSEDSPDLSVLLSHPSILHCQEAC